MAETDEQVSCFMSHIDVTQQSGSELTSDCSPTYCLFADAFCTLHVNNACKVSAFLAKIKFQAPLNIYASTGMLAVLILAGQLPMSQSRP